MWEINKKESSHIHSDLCNSLSLGGTNYYNTTIKPIFNSYLLSQQTLTQNLATKQ